MTSQRLISILPIDMTAKQLIELLTGRQLGMGIPDESAYQHLKSRINSEDTMTTEIATGEIANLEQSAKFDDMFTTTSAVALISKRNPNNNKVCTYSGCLKPGHVEEECHTKCLI